MTLPKTILVVGGAGYIGSHTVLALEAKGFHVVIYDNLSTGHEDTCEGRMFVRGGLNNRYLLTQTMMQHRVDAVIHFAALIEAGISVREPLSFFENNVAGTLSLLDAMDDAGVRRIVFSSTAAVYGNVPTSDALSENLSKAPINPYGDSKAMVETILAAQAKARGLNAIALRYFNAAGADPDQRSGERHEPETHLIPLVMQVAAGLRPEITVFGTDYDTPDGTCIRDYVHVADLAEGHIAALAALEDISSGSFAAYNLGTGRGHSVHEVVSVVEQVSGRAVPIVLAERRIGDPAVLVADARAARNALGWTPQRSSLELIVQDAWKFAHG